MCLSSNRPIMKRVGTAGRPCSLYSGAISPSKGGLHCRNCGAPDPYHRASWKVLGIDEVRLIAAVARPIAIAVVFLEQSYVPAAVRPMEHDDITGLRRAHGGHSPVQPCWRP